MNNLNFEPFEKALVILLLIERSKSPLSPRYGDTPAERTEGFIAALAFDGNREQAEAALEECRQRGFAGETA